MNPLALFFQNLISPVTNPINQWLHSSGSYTSMKSPQPISVPTPSPTPDLSNLAQQIEAGIKKFNPNAPMATASADLAKSYQQIKQSGTKVDPLLSILMALKETRGGLDLLNPKRQLGSEQGGVSNLYNTMPGGRLTNYPDYTTAILGGWNPMEKAQSQGFTNILLSSLYKKYQQSGNTNDLFSTYAPPFDKTGNQINPSLEDQNKTINNLRQYFPGL